MTSTEAIVKEAASESGASYLGPAALPEAILTQQAAKIVLDAIAWQHQPEESIDTPHNLDLIAQALGVLINGLPPKTDQDHEDIVTEAIFRMGTGPSQSNSSDLQEHSGHSWPTLNPDYVATALPLYGGLNG